MNAIPIPAAGHDILPWALAVTRAVNPAFAPANGLARSGLLGDGAEPLPDNLRDRSSSSSSLLPFAVSVRYVAAQEQSEPPTLVASIYIPQGSLSLDGQYIDISPAPDESGWAAIGGFSSASTSLWLNISQGDTPTATLSLDQPVPPGDTTPGGQALSIQIAAFADASVSQLVAGALALSSVISPDGLSLGFSVSSALQILHFDSAESDSPRGLAQRLVVSDDTLSVSDGSAGISLLARRDGKILYIPLSADGSDPSDRDELPDNPCEHPQGGAEGVAPGDAFDDDGSPRPGQAGDSPAGPGIPANGDSHIGDDDCNC